MTRVIVVDDQELVRTGFAMILDKAGLDVVGQGADGEEGVALAAEQRPPQGLVELHRGQVAALDLDHLAGDDQVRAEVAGGLHLAFAFGAGRILTNAGRRCPHRHTEYP